MHTNPNKTCITCATKLLGCHKTLKLWFEIISDKFDNCHVSVGFRDQHDQETALLNHKTHAPWPLSKHNRMEQGAPQSWAMDMFRLGPDGKAYFEKQYFENIWIFIDNLQKKAMDSDLFWGGHFTNLQDYDHFEMLTAKVVSVTESLDVLSQDKC